MLSLSSSEQPEVDAIPLTKEYNIDNAEVGRSKMDAEQEDQKTRIVMLEAEIEKACQEEDYDKAGD